jgi:hypothetical protein
MIAVASSSTQPAPRPFTRCAGVQQVVDRRFNSRCHDADRIIRGHRLCDLADLRQPDREVPAVVDQIMPPTRASLAASTATVRCDCRWHGRTNALVEPSELPADVPSVAWSVRSNSGRRPSDYETDARRRTRRHQTDLACSGWVARRSRRIQKDRRMIKRIIRGHPKENRMPRRAILLSTTELRRSSTGSSTLQTASIA